MSGSNPPGQSDEIGFISGVTANGTVASTSFHTWNGDDPPSYSTDSYASKWGDPTPGTAGGTEYYYFDPASHWTAAEQASFIAGLNLWSAVANIQFAPAANATDADLTFIRGNLVNSGAYESAPNQYSETVGSTALNNQGSGVTISIDTSEYGWEHLASFTDAGGYDIETIVHEEGHFLGLGHDGPYNGNVDSATDQFSAYDTRLWSLMSYIEPQDTAAKYYSAYPVTGTEWNGNDPTTWMPDDILAAQELYGVATVTPLSGGQIFGFDCNVASSINAFFNFTVNVNPVCTIYDTGTGNTLDLSGYGSAETVDLRAGDFSSFDGMVNNLAIAYGTAIDSFIGGTGNVTVQTNSAADNITGGAGGNTSVIFAGDRAGYALGHDSSGITVMDDSTNVTDQLSNVQELVFSDQTVQASSITCFAAGTRIATPQGEIAVEALAVGDPVITFGGFKRIIWVGHRHLDLAGLADPENLYLIRIRRGAFGADTPRRDLLLTQEHCLFINGSLPGEGLPAGGLIPARMLVNGRSIIQDRSITSYSYYHIELEQHGILLAEGLAAESYLDTGNRGNFSNAETAALRPDFAVQAGAKSWADAAAPLTTDAATVRPVWQWLETRARQLGWQLSTPAPALTHDPDLHIFAGGKIIRPAQCDGGKYVFEVPAGPAALHLISRSARPADTIGPFIDDRRALGVLVGDIAISKGRKRRQLTAHLTTPGLPGWHGLGEAGVRWTNGDALLPVPAALGRGRPCRLEITVAAGGPYVDAPVILPAGQAAA